LRTVFSRYGEVTYCKIPASKGCGFVTFALRANAEAALQQLNGYVIGSSRLRLSWGRGLDRVRKNTPPPPQQSVSAPGPMPVQSTLSLPLTSSQPPQQQHHHMHARMASSGQIGVGFGAISLPPPASGPLSSLGGLTGGRRDPLVPAPVQSAIPQLHHSDLSMFQNGVLAAAGAIPAMRSSSYSASDSNISICSAPSILSSLLQQQSHNPKVNLIPRTIGDTFMRQPSPLHDILSFSLSSTTTASAIASSTAVVSSSSSLSLPPSLLKIDSVDSANPLTSFDPFKY